jgi:hypothetical protein
MPLDSTTYAPEIDLTKLAETGHGRLRQCSYLLRHPELWPTHRWKFKTLFEQSVSFEQDCFGTCGTTGCALGVMISHFPSTFGLLYIGIGGERPSFFGVDATDFETIFLTIEAYGKAWAEITPTDVADAIDALLARGVSS